MTDLAGSHSASPRARPGPLGEIPRAYLRKWQRTIDTIANLRPDAAVHLSGVGRDSRLRVLLSAGYGLRPGQLQTVHGPDQQVADSGKPLLRMDGEVTSRDLHAELAGEEIGATSCALPLLWPGGAVYGVLSVYECSERPLTLPWLDLVHQLRLVIESDLRTIYYVREVDVTKEHLEGRIQQRNEELEILNERLIAQLEKSQHLSQVMRRLTTSGDGAYGEAYFRYLVQQLAELFNAEHAFVAVISPQNPRFATTLAAYSRGGWIEDLSYDLAETPCRELLDRPHLLIPNGLMRDFPRAYGRSMPAQSYIGVRLCDAHDQVIGVLVVMGAAASPESRIALQFMELMATRTSTEIQRMRAEQHLRWLSEMDELTGLMNRNSFLRRLTEVLVADEPDRRLAVMFIDLDNFKTVNDTLGHDVGDELLAQVGQRIRRSFGGDDVVARLGGDEFAALVEICDEDRLTALCTHLGERFDTPFVCQNQELFLSVSIGVSQYPQDGCDTRTLLRMADIAMYQAKERGKNQLQFYSQSLKDKIDYDLRIANRLRRALNAKQFEVYYQPKVDTRTRAVVGAEALLRWRDLELGEVSPLVFIPLAQRTGTIDTLGDQVVKMVAGHIQAWQSEGLQVPSIAVNVSPAQLRDNRFAVRLASQLHSYCVNPSLLTLELTEDALMLHSGAGLSTLVDLADRGFRISIDDFGTGYSSLSYLRSMPIKEVKIDRSFIRGIAEHADDRAIAAAILSLARTLGLDVVAEGVERESQLQVLTELSCTTAQGFLFHRPMPEPEFRLLLGRAERDSAGRQPSARQPAG